MSQHVLDPIEAMRRLASRLRTRRSERTPIEQALGRRLAAPVEIPARRSGEGLRRSTLNGYALRRGQGVGEYAFKGEGTGDPNGPIPGGGQGEPADLPLVERVESGSILPSEIERVVPVEWTTVVASAGGGPSRVRILEEAIPPHGYGVAGSGETAEEVEQGTWISPRLLALLLSREVTSVETYVPLRIGILAIGSDLTDILGGSGPSSGTAWDLTGLWLPLLIRSLGHLPHSLGIAGDEPAEGREAFLRARRLGLDAVVTTGGLGDGLSDRTAELILRTGGQVTLDGVAMRPGRRFLFGETMELRILGLGGQPLDASAAFDLLLRPALLSSLGAPDVVWDWPRASFPASRIKERPEAPFFPARGGFEGPALWSAIPVRKDAAEDGYCAIARAAPETAFLPWIPGQDGWAVLPPLLAGHPREGRAFFQPCEISGEMCTLQPQAPSLKPQAKP